MPIFNFLPLLVWLLVFYALNQRQGEHVKESNPKAVFFSWVLGGIIFLAAAIWTTARS